MLTDELLTKKEHFLLTEHLNEPRTPVFYRLPKIHKMFSNFPPLRPIVSGYKSCSNRLSEYLDSFLKFQAQKCNSYVRDTKDFLNKINDLQNLPSNSTLVTMDVSSLYTNKDHNEGAESCFIKLQTRKNKTVSSELLRKLIIIVLKSNAFRFGN